MLLPINPETPVSNVLTMLNKELLYFLEQSAITTTFSSYLFLDGEISPCYANQPTREKFEAVHQKLIRLTQPERQKLYDSLLKAQPITTYFDKLDFELPFIDESLFDALHKLGCHLFRHTKMLQGLIKIAGESINEHYEKYKEINGLVCRVCGTETLSQDRSGVGDKEQWIADYDHLLPCSKYPLFAVHPQNFLPTCHICNSKAKGSKDLITDDKGGRRLAFYPYQENCSRYIRVFSTNNQPGSIFELEVKHDCSDPYITQKINVWESIYQVPQRVKSLLSHITIWLASDCRANSIEEYREQIHKRKDPRDIKKTELAFWRALFYQWLDQHEEEREAIIAAVMTEQQNNHNNYQETYGI